MARDAHQEGVDFRAVPPNSWPKIARQALARCAAVALGLTLPGVGTARADMVEGLLQSGTDPVQSHLFPVNPAFLVPKGLQGGVIVGRRVKSVKLDQSNRNDDVINNDATDDHVGVSALVDLGAGAGLGFSHQLMYRKVETSLSSQRQNDIELMKEQQSSVRLVIELITDLRVAMAIRYLYQDVMLIGSPRLGENMATFYRTTMVGYGSGAAYATKNWALGYAYFPPLRGKTDIEGEEKIVVESGEIDADASVNINPVWSAGLSLKRWIHELDDRKFGTTAKDDTTAISLYGLDVDQYLFQQQLAMLGAQYSASKETAIRFAVGQEQSEFNFQDLSRFQGLNVQQGGNQGNPGVRANKAGVFVRFTTKNVQLDAGFRMFTRKTTFPDTMRGATYDSSGRDMVATIGMKL